MSVAPSLAVWLETLGILALGSSVLVTLAALLARRVPSAIWKRTLWRSAMIGLAILMICEGTGAVNWLTANFSLDPSPIPEGEKPPAGLRRPFAYPLPALGEEKPPAGLRRPFAYPLESETTEPEHTPDGLLESGVWWPGVLWLTGTLVIAARSLLGRGLLIVFRRRHPSSCDVALNERVRSVAERLGFHRRVRVMEAAGLCSPVTFGILRPTIAVPADFTTNFDVPHQEVMLAHELAHLAACDPAWLLLTDLVAAVLWWQPLVWCLRHQLRSASERAADEASLVVADGPGLLAACLIELGTRLAAPGRAGWVRMAGTGFRSSLGRRVERLLRLRDQPWRPPGGIRSRLGFSLAAAALLTCAVLSTAWVRPRASQEGDMSMPTMQRSWQRSLVGALMLTVLAPANDATHAEDPPRPLEKVTAEGRTLQELEREMQRIKDVIDKLQVQLADMRARSNGELPIIKRTEARIGELEAQKRELEDEQKALDAKQIRVFRLKHVKPEEVRQALESLLGRPAGLGYTNPPGSMMPAGRWPPGGGVVRSSTPRSDWRLTIDERTQSIIMRGSRVDLQRAADLIAVLDLPSGKPIPKVKNLRAFKLKYAPVETLCQILGQLDLDARILPLKETNRLIVAGPDSVVKEVTELIEELDVETERSPGRLFAPRGGGN